MNVANERFVAPRGAGGADAVILVVDDIADNRDLLMRRLTRRGYRVIEAVSGPEALGIVAAQHVDLVLLDVMMPEMSGHEVLIRLRAQASPQDLAVIMVTARDASSEIAAALDGGANDYLTKPLDFKILEARVNAQLRQMAAAREPARMGPAAAQRTTDADSLDTLTGLLSRRAFEARVSRSLVSARRSSSHHTVVVMNIDDFRLVNAAYGQSAGDRVLQEVAETVRRSVGRDDVVARLGGGEFGVLLYDCDGRQSSTRLRELAQRVRQSRTLWRETPITTTVSMGLVEIGAHDASVSEVLRAAALTCEAAKQFGKDQIRVYDKGDDSVSTIQRQADWAVKLQRALNQDQLVLYAQPIVSTTERFQGPVSYEILVRMIDPLGAIISPHSFLTAAETHGLMPELDRWVLEHTIQLLAARNRSPRFAPKRICINLSGHSLASADFQRFAHDVIENSPVDPRLICFEITETATIQRIDQAREFIHGFIPMGVQFALDDFGSGVSSFGYLRELPVDFVKIDGRFVRTIESSPIDRAIVAAVNEIAHVLGKKTVAEFVENEDAATELASMSVDYLQGYHIGRPMPFDEIVGVPARGEHA
jgi:diguanylate cyclase (GGDEF)-like protein